MRDALHHIDRLTHTRTPAEDSVSVLAGPKLNRVRANLDLMQAPLLLLMMLLMMLLIIIIAVIMIES